VKLDDGYYKLVDKLERLTKQVPSLKHCSSLTVKGPVRFGAGVVIKGDVTLDCAGPEPVTLQGVTLESGKHTVRRPEEAPVPAGVPAFA